MKQKNLLQNLSKIRNVVQITFSLFLLYVGWQFYNFVNYFRTEETTKFVSRPSAVEGFLPLSALMSLKQWLITGIFDQIHPAGLVLLLTIILISFLFKKGFCSWICPIGLISESLGEVGKRIFGKTFKLPKIVDRLMMIPKYLILVFFIKVIFFDMSVRAITGFLRSPYNLIADVKMLYFFLDPSPLKIKVLLFLAVGSILVKNFWCRYLCPYGALLGLVSLVSPIKITRNEERCTGCQKCISTCPNQIEVAEKRQVNSPECNSCLNCISACPNSGQVLNLSIYKRINLSPLLYPIFLLGVFLTVVMIAKFTGHWETSISTEMYQRLIPQIESIGHF